MGKLQGLVASGVLGCAALLTAFTGCSKIPNVWPDKPGKRVLVSFAPLYCMVQNVAGDDANVLCMSAASGPHGTEMTHEDILKFRKADIIIGNGLELDSGFLKTLRSKSGRDINIVFIGDLLPDDKLIHLHEHHDHNHGDKKDGKIDIAKDDHGHSHGHGHDHHGHSHSHGDHDPHVWLSPVLAEIMVDKIKTTLTDIDPDHGEGYAKRAEEYKKKLKELHNYGLKAFKGKEKKQFVAQHDSLRYFARAFKLPEPLALRQTSGIENNPGELKKLVQESKNVAVLTYEPQFPRREVEALHKTLKDYGVDTKIVEVDTIETANLEKGQANPSPEYYIERLKKNIDNLSKALP